MARENTLLKPGKTYINAARARIAAENAAPENARYFIAYNEEGRAFPIFIGREAFDASLYRKGFICILN
jgi:hypothetical protein